MVLLVREILTPEPMMATTSPERVEAIILESGAE